MSDKEVWRDIKGYKGFYQVSNFGNIRSLDRMVEHRIKGNYRKAKGVPMKPQRRDFGHYDILLKMNGKQERIWVHRLVAKAFLKNPKKLPIVNHIDHDPSNNHASNLEWCTHSHNIKHAIAAGRRHSPKGEDHRCARLTEDQVRKIRNERESGKTFSVIADKYSITPSHVSHICRRKKWKHVL